MGIGQGLLVIKAFREGTATTDTRHVASSGAQSTSNILSDAAFVWAATATAVERWDGGAYVPANVSLPGGINLFQSIAFSDGSSGPILEFDDPLSTDTQIIHLHTDNLAKMATLTGAPAVTNSYRNFVDAFIEGGRINITLGANGTLRLHLRSLLTGDYALVANVLQPAHHALAAGTANNCTLIDGETDGSFTISLTGYDLPGGGALGPISGIQDAITLDSGDSAPINASSSAVVLSIQRSFAADPGDASINASIATTEVPIQAHVPTELLILLDRSGSMNGTSDGAGTTKWDTAKNVSNLFSHLYAELTPERTASSGTLVSKNTLQFGHFRWSGGAEDANFESVNPAEDQTEFPTTISPGGGTPIGEALVEAGSEFTSNKWKRRLLLLLTDGMDNRGTPSLLDLSASQLKSLSAIGTTPGDPDDGVILHALSYAKATDTDPISLSAKAAERNGALHTTASSFDGESSPEALLRAYLPFLSEVLPAEYSTYTTDTYTAEAGLDKLVLVTTVDPSSVGTGATSYAVVSGGTMVGDATAGNTSGYWWVSIPNPPADSQYALHANNSGTLTALTGAQIYAFKDLAIRTKFGVDASEIGKPVKLWAKATFNGKPIEGADIRAAMASPGESSGDLATQFVASGGLMKAVQRGTLNVQNLAASLVAMNASLRKAKQPVQPIPFARTHSVAAFDMTHAAGIKLDPKVDLQAVRAQLLSALEAERNLGFQYDRYPIKLEDKGEGLYEYEIPADAVQWAGIYTADFRADGFVAGAPFARDMQVSKFVAEPPSQDLSAVSVTETTPQSGNWTVTVKPVNARGLPLGPGLAHRASFQYVNAKERQNPDLPQLLTQDNLDGTYSTKLSTRAGGVPEVALFFGNPDAGAPKIVARPKPDLCDVKIVLEKIEVLNDHDPCIKGAGELVFTTSVSPNGSPGRTVRARFPEKEHFKLNSGESVQIGETIFEGKLEKKDQLFISISGEELDWPACFDPNDQLSRYIRRIPVPSKTKKYTPDDEKNDPESLADWKVWYTVEVS